jgi:hypothetical protein
VTGRDVAGDDAAGAAEEVVAGRTVVPGRTVGAGARGVVAALGVVATTVVAVVALRGPCVWDDDAHAARSTSATMAATDAETGLVGCAM